MSRTVRRRLPVLMLLLCAPLVVSTSQVVDPSRVSAEQTEAGICEAGPMSSREVQTAAQLRAREAREEALRRIAQGEQAAGHDVIVLNGQGYNYAAGRDPRQEALLRRRFEEQGVGRPARSER